MHLTSTLLCIIIIIIVVVVVVVVFAGIKKSGPKYDDKENGSPCGAATVDRRTRDRQSRAYRAGALLATFAAAAAIVIDFSYLKTQVDDFNSSTSRWLLLRA